MPDHIHVLEKRFHTGPAPLPLELTTRKRNEHMVLHHCAKRSAPPPHPFLLLLILILILQFIIPFSPSSRSSSSFPWSFSNYDNPIWKIIQIRQIVKNWKKQKDFSTIHEKQNSIGSFCKNVRTDSRFHYPIAISGPYPPKTQNQKNHYRFLIFFVVVFVRCKYRSWP